jgi:hypothetical protein
VLFSDLHPYDDPQREQTELKHSNGLPVTGLNIAVGSGKYFFHTKPPFPERIW